jgi:hypothetical protein
MPRGKEQKIYQPFYFVIFESDRRRNQQRRQSSSGSTGDLSFMLDGL